MSIRRPRPPREVLEELEYSLNLLEADSHSGMDNKTATRLRAILTRRIAETKAELPSLPTESGSSVAVDELPE